MADSKKTWILFDCDNTLVLSEELAFEACADLANEILEKYKIDFHPYTGPKLMNDFVGQNFRGVLTNLQKRYDFTIPDDDLEKYVKMEEDRVIANLEKKAQPCEGVMPVLEKLAREKKYEMAVVSSSALRRVIASLKKVGQTKYFPDNLVFSAATSLPKPTSKPDPAIYLHACKEVGTDPKNAIAVEDSKSGTLSAVRAGIPVVAYVGSYDKGKQDEMAKVLMDAGAKTLMKHWSEFDEQLACIHK